MPEWGIAPNIQLSEFALKLRQYRHQNRLSFDEIAARLWVSAQRIFELEMDYAKPNFFEKWRLNRLIAKQKTASTK